MRPIAIVCAITLIASCGTSTVPTSATQQRERVRASGTATRRVVGYLPGWSAAEGFTAADVDFSVVTDVAHFSVLPRADGSIDRADWHPNRALVRRAHAARARALLVIGRGDDPVATASFSALAASPRARARFATAVRALVDTYGYDGVDLDWEFPADAADRTHLPELVAALRAELGPSRSISLAVGAGPWLGQWLDVDALLANVDWLGVMTYDSHGSWEPQPHSGHNAPLYTSANDDALHDDADAPSVARSFEYFRARGVPASKLLLGLPFYGRSFDHASDVNERLDDASGDSLGYDEVLARMSSGWTRRHDVAAGVPYLVRDDGLGVVSYDDPGSIAAKCRYVVAKHLGGVIVWHLGKDGRGQPLLEATRGCM